MVVAAGAFIGPAAAPVAPRRAVPTNPGRFAERDGHPGTRIDLDTVHVLRPLPDDFRTVLTSAVVNVAGVGSFNLTLRATGFGSPGVST